MLFKIKCYQLIKHVHNITYSSKTIAGALLGIGLVLVLLMPRFMLGANPSIPGWGRGDTLFLGLANPPPVLGGGIAPKFGPLLAAGKI